MATYRTLDQIIIESHRQEADSADASMKPPDGVQQYVKAKVVPHIYAKASPTAVTAC
jgi:hypothetical protein